MESCEFAVWNCVDHDLSPNSDIAGIGVLVAFLVSAWLTVVLAFLAYCFSCVPEELLNNCDRKFFRRSTNRNERWTRLMQDTIMVLSDQQIVTGIAILVAAFSQFDKLSIYDWHNAVYLAWMSSTVHLTSLTYLRAYLQERTVLRAWRLTGMLLLFGLLFAALYPTTDSQWMCIMRQALPYALPEESAVSCRAIQYPSRCFWSNTSYNMKCSRANHNSADGVVTYAFLVVSYSWKAAMLFGPPRRRLATMVRSWLLRPFEMHIRRLSSRQTSKFRKVLYRLTLIMYFPVLAAVELAGSFAGALWTVSIGLICGTLQLTIPRNALKPVESSGAQKEDKWDFGQVLPVLLLVSPLIAIGTQFFAADANHPDAHSQNPHPQLSGRCLNDNHASQSGNLRASSISTLFSALDSNNTSTFQDLYSAIYRTRAFEIILGFLNYYIGLMTIATFVLNWLWPNHIFFFIGAGIVYSFCQIINIPMLCLPWSRLYL